MPTTKPRAQVLLEPETHASLMRIARYMDTSMSSLIGKLVEEAAPTLHQLADALENAHGLALKLPGGLEAHLAALGRQAEELEHGTQELLDGVLEQADAKREEQGEKLRRRPASQGKTL